MNPYHVIESATQLCISFYSIQFERKAQSVRSNPLGSDVVMMGIEGAIDFKTSTYCQSNCFYHYFHITNQLSTNKAKVSG